MKVPESYLGIRKPRIEMLPLIDIVFLLLVFFIYAMLSMAVHRSLPVSLPVSAAAQITKEVNIVVSVRPNGDVYLDNVSISRNELQAALLERNEGSGAGKSVRVDLFADRNLPYQELYRILDIIRSAGIENVSLQAEIDR
jgi:biopolymer transport protein ExbD